MSTSARGDLADDYTRVVVPGVPETFDVEDGCVGVVAVVVVVVREVVVVDTVLVVGTPGGKSLLCLNILKCSSNFWS